MSNETNKTYSLDLEKSILGAMVINYEWIPEVVEIIKNHELFYLNKHQIIFNSIIKLYSGGQIVDEYSVCDNLQITGEGEALAGSYLSELIEFGNKILGNIKYYCNLLREKYLRRQLALKCIETLKFCQNGVDTSIKLINNLSSDLVTITGDILDSKDNSYGEALDELLWIKENRGIIPGIKSGYSYFDKINRGFDVSEYILLAGRTSMGKTCFMLNLAHNIVNRDIPVGILGLESTLKKLYMRLVCKETKFDMDSYYLPDCTDENINMAISKLGEIGTLNLHIEEVHGISIMELKAKAVSLKKKYDIKILFIDHLGEIFAEGKTVFEQTTFISKQLKSLTMEMRIPVVALCQLNRKAPDREEKEPRLSDLRNSGELEQQADKVIFIHRPNYYLRPGDKYKSDEPGQPENMQIIIAKNRDGKTGLINLKYYGLWGLITDYANKEERDKMVRNCEGK